MTRVALGALLGCGGLLAGCARGAADDRFVLDASLAPVGGPDAASSSEDAAGPDREDDASRPRVDAGGTPDCLPDMVDCPVRGDASTQVPDAGTPDAHVTEPDAGRPSGALDVTFRVLQRHAALQEALTTDVVLAVGDRLRFTATGNIWPGLVAQPCNGPSGTSGTHTGADWPLQGGPDFALVARVNGAWRMVGAGASFVVSEPGMLELGTNDNNNQTGDDCTSVGVDARGFSVRVERNPVGP